MADFCISLEIYYLEFFSIAGETHYLFNISFWTGIDTASSWYARGLGFRLHTVGSFTVADLPIFILDAFKVCFGYCAHLNLCYLRYI